MPGRPIQRTNPSASSSAAQSPLRSGNQAPHGTPASGRSSISVESSPDRIQPRHDRVGRIPYGEGFPNNAEYYYGAVYEYRNAPTDSTGNLPFPPDQHHLKVQLADKNRVVTLSPQEALEAYRCYGPWCGTSNIRVVFYSAPLATDNIEGTASERPRVSVQSTKRNMRDEMGMTRIASAV